MKRVFGVIVAVVALAGTDVLGGDAKDPLKGTWSATEVEFKGRKKPFPEGAYSLTFAAGNKLNVKGGKKDEEGTYKVDASKKPGHLDITTKKGDKDETVQLIYEVKGDTLKLGFPMGGPAAGRPKDFTAEDTVVMYLKKQKS
jgi:uncharacterized protein (TIGR03067 family)